MQLTEHTPGNHFFIRSVTTHAVVIGDETLHQSVIVGARLLERDWPVRDVGDLTEHTVKPLIELQPELVILGVGERQRIAPPQIAALFMQHRIGFECMNLAAACRTFNVLMSENRRAVAALILDAPHPVANPA